MNDEKVLVPNFQVSFWSSCVEILTRYWKVLLLVSWPLIIIALNNSWLQMQLHYIDPWVYFGYFLNLEKYFEVFPGTYYGARLPWILPGFLAYRFFPPEIANIVLHLVFYYISTFSLYFVLRRAFNAQTGLLTALLMGSHSFFLRALFWDYVDGVAIAYFLLTISLMTLESSYSRIRICFSGVALGCAVYTQFYLIIFAPLLVFYFFSINKGFSKSVLESFLSFISGFFAITFGLCLVNYFFLGGPFLFFSHTIVFATSLISKNVWWVPISIWWRNGYHLVFPFLVFLMTIFGLVFYKESKSESSRRAAKTFQLFCVLSVFLVLFVEFVKKQPVLSCDFYASYLFPAIFLSYGSVLSFLIEKQDKKKVYIVMVLFFVLQLALNYNFVWIQRSSPPNLFLGLTASFFGVFLLCSFIPFLRKWVSFISLILLLVSGNFLFSQSYAISRNSKKKTNLFAPIVESVRLINKMDSSVGSFFWYDLSSKNIGVYRSISSCYLWGYRLINENFPQTQSSASKSLAPGDRIFVLSEKPDVKVLINRSLAELSLRGVFLDEKSIDFSEGSYKIIHFQVCNIENLNEL